MPTSPRSEPPTAADPSGPVIGITAGELVASYGVWKERASLVPADYVHATANAGGVPIVLSPVTGLADPLLDRVDGLMLTGGADVGAGLFGAERHPKAQRPDETRDAFELALLEGAVARAVPVLAICRGIQVLNVWRGGTLIQHLADVGADRNHLETPGEFGNHRVRIDPTSRLGSIIGSDQVDVPTHHHQAVDRIGEGLVATAWTADGVVEGLEDPELAYLVAVQWHPEVGEDRSLFESLVAAARSRAALGHP
ncbi:MAG: gamma-glutamyl-gamma-aminobutyrate hydrolase family protein [Acidimicrobiales bacterium]